MSETKDFPTLVIASLTTGVLLVPSFGDVHQAAEWLMGHPIWTHHLANKELWAEMTKTVLAQCPGMPTEADTAGVDKANWKAFADKIVADIGPTVTLRKGGGLTALLPTDGIPDHLKDRTIMVET